MRRSNDFSLFYIADVPYLLPFGQGIADQKRGIQVNDTGAYIWELLDRNRTEDEILSLCASHYEVPDCRLPQLKDDLHQFLHILDTFDMLNRSGDPTPSDAASDSITCSTGTVSVSVPGNASVSAKPTNEPENRGISSVHTDIVNRYLSIGGLTLLLTGPAEAFSTDFDAFEIFPDPVTDPTDASTPGSSSHIDQTITVTDHVPEPLVKNNILLKNRELTVMENDLQYIFLFPAAQGIYEARLSKNGADACYYCCPPYTESLRQDLFHAIRLSFLYLAQLHNMVVLHSASLLYRHRAWLFSGHSGAGKSTHTNLWKELYNTPLLNGDLNLLSVENGCPMVHGLPWCGTSGITDIHSYPLGGILFVKKALQNCITTLDTSHAQLFVTQRLISPSWTASLLQKNLRLAAELSPHILICRLYCTKEPEAAATARRAIDDYLALPYV